LKLIFLKKILSNFLSLKNHNCSIVIAQNLLF
jgi:hypothetical protein